MTKIALVVLGRHTSWCSRRYLYYRYIGCNSGPVSHPNRLIPLYMGHDGRFSFQHVCKKNEKVTRLLFFLSY
jgi:hypothetical protein